MEIRQLSLLNGAKKAKGLTVIIDVFRAFSVECYLFKNGAERVYPVGSIEEAYQIHKENSDFILMGERKEKICEGFDYGNSPTHIEKLDFTGKTIIHTTSSGTQGVMLASNASEIITGSFVNARAIINYIKAQKPEILSLVAMGYEGKYKTQEDELCSDYLKNGVHNITLGYKSIVDTLRTGDGARLLNPMNNEHSPSTDFDLCLALNTFNFVLKIQKDEMGRNFLQKINID